MDFLPYIFTPLLCAAIGYSTNWLAIRMLFRPHREIRIAGLRLPFTPGLIPKERQKLARKIAETVSRHVLTPEVLAHELAALAKSAENNMDGRLPQLVDWLKDGISGNPALESWLVEMVKKVIQEHVGRFAGIFLDAEKIYASVKEGLFTYISDPDNQAFLLTKAEGHMRAPGFERALENIVVYIAHHIPIQEMIENKMNAFAVDEAEKIILSVVRRELQVITALGGVLGFIIGLLSLLV